MVQTLTCVQLIKMRINIWRSDGRLMIKFISVKHDLVSTKHLSKSKKTGSNLCGLPWAFLLIVSLHCLLTQCLTKFTKSFKLTESHTTPNFSKKKKLRLLTVLSFELNFEIRKMFICSCNCVLTCVHT